MLESRYAHVEILLNNGDVYISGGSISWIFVEVDNVATTQWQSADDILGYRSFHKVYYLSSAICYLFWVEICAQHQKRLGKYMIQIL